MAFNVDEALFRKGLAWQPGAVVFKGNLPLIEAFFTYYWYFVHKSTCTHAIRLPTSEQPIILPVKLMGCVCMPAACHICGGNML